MINNNGPISSEPSARRENKLVNIQRARKRSSISYPNIKTFQGYNSATNKSQIRDTKGSLTKTESLSEKIDINNSNNLISDFNKYFN